MISDKQHADIDTDCLDLADAGRGGASIRGVLRTMHTPLGYDPHHVMSVGIPIQDGTSKTWGERRVLRTVTEKSRDVPRRHLYGDFQQCHTACQRFPDARRFLGKTAQDEQEVLVNFVSPACFPVLRIPLAQERTWDETENRSGAHLAVINQTLARRYFPTGNAIGHSLKCRRFRTGRPTTSPRRMVPDGLHIVGWSRTSSMTASTSRYSQSSLSSRPPCC